jgi:drug/metabolite transporter (DMT)-like permease
VTLGYLYAILAAIGWGLVYALEQRLLTHFSPALVLFMNSVCAIVMLAPFLLTRLNDFSTLARPGGSVWLLLGVSLLAAVTNLLILNSIKELNAPIAAIIEVSYPLFVIIASYFLFGFRPSPQLLLGAALVIAGVLVITYSST